MCLRNVLGPQIIYVSKSLRALGTKVPLVKRLVPRMATWYAMTSAGKKVMQKENGRYPSAEGAYDICMLLFVNAETYDAIRSHVCHTILKNRTYTRPTGRVVYSSGGRHYHPPPSSIDAQIDEITQRAIATLIGMGYVSRVDF